ncbi:MAG TPA: methionyl-tRNA formyltransferase [Candidatus Paceibacterota bacterium]|nr:methionyl-tRNA formyltransferase [Candidatus Paceibacterota bacterium]
MSAKKPLFAFFGTPQVGVHVLNRLDARGYLPALVVSAPDKPRGRGHSVSPSPVKAWALERGIDVLTPATLKDEEFLSALQNTDWDVFVVAAYNKLIPKTLLKMPRRGCLNMHPSLLPKFRGPSPIMSAILEDERETGVSVMQMSEEMDAGPVVAQARVEIATEDWPLSNAVLEELLSTEGGNLLAETLEPWIAGEIPPEPQNPELATYTKKFSDEDARIDLSDDARNNLLKIRAFDRGPRAYMLMPDGKRVIITDAEIQDGALEILTVIPEGKKEMEYKAFLHSS